MFGAAARWGPAGMHPCQSLYLPGHLSWGSEAATQCLAFTITGAPPTFPPRWQLKQTWGLTVTQPFLSCLAVWLLRQRLQ